MPADLGRPTWRCTRSVAASMAVAQITGHQERLLANLGAAAMLAVVADPWPDGLFGVIGPGESERVVLTPLGVEVMSICQERANVE